MSDQLKVYFMGTGDIAVPVLKALFNSVRINLVGVCTQPDRAKGRKKVLTPSPLGAVAEELGVEVIDKPATVNTPEFVAHLEVLAPDVIVVIAFGQLLKSEVLELPKFGCINLHASILPKYRGASPINAVLLNGDSETGVTVMRMEKGLDTGPITLIHTIAIESNDSYFTLEEKLGDLGAATIVEDLYTIASGSEFEIQDHALATHVGKISKNDGLADWSLDATQLERISRAYFPWPGLFFYLKTGKRERKISVVKATVVSTDSLLAPGAYLQADKEAWIVKCGKDALRLDVVGPDGSPQMSGPDFLRGVQL